MSEPTAMPPPVDAQAPTPHVKSKGEKLFDRAVYGGIAGVGTFVVTLPIAYKLNHGNWAGGHYGRIVNWVEKQAAHLFKPALSRKIAKESVMTTSLMMGGNAMLLPVGIAEHYKTPIVEKLNAAMGDTTPPEAIEQSPKQTWSSLIEGRLLAWGVVFASIMGASWAIPKTFATFNTEFAERSHQLAQWFSRNKTPVADMEKSVSYRVGRLAALDVFATAAAATLLYVGGHFFARKHEEKKERKTLAYQSHHGELAADGAEGTNAVAAETVATPASNAAATPDPTVRGHKLAQGTVAPAALAVEHGA